MNIHNILANITKNSCGACYNMHESCIALSKVQVEPDAAFMKQFK